MLGSRVLLRTVEASIREADHNSDDLQSMLTFADSLERQFRNRGCQRIAGLVETRIIPLIQKELTQRQLNNGITPAGRCSDQLCLRL